MKCNLQKLAESLEDARTSEFARKEGNERKNRQGTGILPFDRNRIILAPVLGQADASYIVRVKKLYLKSSIIVALMDSTGQGSLRGHCRIR